MHLQSTAGLLSRVASCQPGLKPHLNMSEWHPVTRLLAVGKRRPRQGTRRRQCGSSITGQALRAAWVLLQAGIVAGLVAVLRQPSAPIGVKADVTLGLKHLTASSQRNRDALVNSGGLMALVPLLLADSAEAQYNTARILRHLALGSPPEHKIAVLPAIVPLVEALKVPMQP